MLADVDSLSEECKSLLGVSRRLEEVENVNANEISGPTLSYNMTVGWDPESKNGLISNVSNLVAKAKNMTVLIKEAVERIEDKVVWIEEKLEDEFPSKVGKADKESDEAEEGEEDTERNRMLEMENLNEKLDWMEKYVKDLDKYVKDMDKRVNDKLDKVLSTMVEI